MVDRPSANDVHPYVPSTQARPVPLGTVGSTATLTKLGWRSCRENVTFRANGQCVRQDCANQRTCHATRRVSIYLSVHAAHGQEIMPPWRKSHVQTMGAANRVTHSPFSRHPIRRTAHKRQMSRFPYISANRLWLVCC